VHLTAFIIVLLFHCPVCRNINIKGKYGFIEFDEAEDAEDAVKELDGKSFNGGRYAVPGPHGSGSGAELDPDSIGSVDPDSESGSGSGSRRAKITHKSRKKLRNFMFMKCWMFYFEC
jgi:hypothetical protein